jgi:hypothetical protein
MPCSAPSARHVVGDAGADRWAKRLAVDDGAVTASTPRSVAEVAAAGEHHDDAVLVAAAMTSSSRTEPPGLDDRAHPGGRGGVGPSRNGKNASLASTAPRWRPPDFSTARRTLSTRLICPAPTPTTARSLVSTIALDLTCLQAIQANAARPGRLVGLASGTVQSSNGSSPTSASWTSSPPSMVRSVPDRGGGRPVELAQDPQVLLGLQGLERVVGRTRARSRPR